MTSHYDKNAYKDYEKVSDILDAVLSELSTMKKDHQKEVKKFKNTINKLTKQAESLQQQLDNKDKEILRLKSKNK